MPPSSDTLTCKPLTYCTGIQCCAAIDIKFTTLFLNAWMEIDPCTLELSIGLGRWNDSVLLVASDWSVPKQVEIAETLLIT